MGYNNKYVLKKWLKTNESELINEIKSNEDIELIELIELSECGNIENNNSKVYEWYEGCCGMYIINVNDELEYGCECIGYDGEYFNELGRCGEFKNMSIDDLLESKRGM